MDIRFEDHASFHRAAAGMVLGSLLAGTASYLVTSGSASAPLFGGVIGIAVGAAWAYGAPRLRLATAPLAALPLAALPLGWPALALAALLASLGVGLGGGRGARGALAIAAGAGAILLAMWCGLRVDTARETHAWPGWAIDAAAAAAIGAVATLATLPRHVSIAFDPVRAALRRLPAGLDPEVRALCARAGEIWGAAGERLAAADPGWTLVRDGVLKTLEVAVRSADIRPALDGEGDLAARIAELDRRIAAAPDAEIAAQYTAARDGLEDQRRYRARIAQGRELLVARMHNHIAALEKFQLAATGLAAVRAAAPGSPAAQLAELSSDVAASGEALAEVELG